MHVQKPLCCISSNWPFYNRTMFLLNCEIFFRGLYRDAAGNGMTGGIALNMNIFLDS